MIERQKRVSEAFGRPGTAAADPKDQAAARTGEEAERQEGDWEAFRLLAQNADQRGDRAGSQRHSVDRRTVCRPNVGS